MNKTLDYYNTNFEKFNADTANASMYKIRNEFLELVPVEGRILDLGCGSGRDAKAFLDMGYKVDAIDGSKELCKIASELIGQDVINVTFEEFDTEKRYSGIWACASLPHVEYEGLNALLTKYASLLDYDGVFYLSFKYGDFEGYRNGRYFTDLDEKRLIEILPESLQITKTFITGDVRAGRENEKWLNVLAVRK